MAETQTWSQESFGSEALEFCLGLLARFSRSRVQGLPGAVAADRDADSGESPLNAFREATESLGRRIEGVRALALVRLDGEIDEMVSLDPDIRPEAVSEFATLVRIADRTSQDAGTLQLSETTWSSLGGTVLTRRVGPDRFLILVGGDPLRVSLARYALRQTAKRLDAARPRG